jgi:hypothetical protein
MSDDSMDNELFGSDGEEAKDVLPIAEAPTYFETQAFKDY